MKGTFQIHTELWFVFDFVLFYCVRDALIKVLNHGIYLYGFRSFLNFTFFLE